MLGCVERQKGTEEKAGRVEEKAIGREERSRRGLKEEKKRCKGSIFEAQDKETT